MSFDDYDTNNDGELTYEEFLAGSHSVQNCHDPAREASLFVIKTKMTAALNRPTLEDLTNALADKAQAFEKWPECVDKELKSLIEEVKKMQALHEPPPPSLPALQPGTTAVASQTLSATAGHIAEDCGGRPG